MGEGGGPERRGMGLSYRITEGKSPRAERELSAETPRLTCPLPLCQSPYAHQSLRASPGERRAAHPSSFHLPTDLWGRQEQRS